MPLINALSLECFVCVCVCVCVWTLKGISAESPLRSLSMTQLVKTTADSVNFHVDRVFQKKKIKAYPNNKPFIAKEVKALINKKKLAFVKNDLIQMQQAQKELNQKLKESKRHYKEKLIDQCKTMNTKKLWKTVRTVVDMKTSRKPLHANDKSQFADELNSFTKSLMLLTIDRKTTQMLHSVETDFMTQLTSQWIWWPVFSKTCARKATGPDGISAFLLRTCTEEIAPVW